MPPRLIESIRAYARQAKNKDLEADAFEIRIRAERKLGQLLVAHKETEGLQVGARGRSGGGTRGSQKEPQLDAPPTLADMGLDKKLSSRAQPLAKATGVCDSYGLSSPSSRVGGPRTPGAIPIWVASRSTAGTVSEAWTNCSELRLCGEGLRVTPRIFQMCYVDSQMQNRFAIGIGDKDDVPMSTRSIKILMRDLNLPREQRQVRQTYKELRPEAIRLAEGLR